MRRTALEHLSYDSFNVFDITVLAGKLQQRGAWGSGPWEVVHADQVVCTLWYLKCMVRTVWLLVL